MERAYNPAIPHQDLRGPGRVLIQAGQDTMRAHHIADRQIQQMVCDYMNGQITLLTLLDRLGVLYLTSWIDVVVTPRLFYIWRQWAHSLESTFGIALASFRGLAPNQQARLATNLAAALSSSISNLRVVSEGLYDRKIEFIAAGNVYYTRRKKLTWLLKAAEKAGICLDHSAIDKSANPQIVRVSSANKDKSGVQK